MRIRFHNGQLYAYEAIRRHGKPTHRYLGRVTPELAESMLAINAAEQADREKRQEQARATREAHRRKAEAIAGEVSALVGAALAAGRSAIEAAGYRQHKRQWRKRRAMLAQPQPAHANITPAKRRQGPMARALETQLVEWATGDSCDDLPFREELRADIHRVEAELAGPDPTPTEAILAESAAQAWFLHKWLEYELAGRLRSGKLPTAQEEQRQRRIDRAHRKFLDTVRMIATLRRLALPHLQVNIANIAGAAPQAPPTCARSRLG